MLEMLFFSERDVGVEIGKREMTRDDRNCRLVILREDIFRMTYSFCWIKAEEPGRYSFHSRGYPSVSEGSGGGKVEFQPPHSRYCCQITHEINNALWQCF